MVASIVRDDFSADRTCKLLVFCDTKLGQARAHPVAALGALDFMQACGMVFIGTMADTLIVESMRRFISEGRSHFGALQATVQCSVRVGLPRLDLDQCYTESSR